MGPGAGPDPETLPGDRPEDDAPRYDPQADLRWLLLRPWILVSRLIVVLWQLGTLALVLVSQSRSRDPRLQKRLARRILTTLTGLGPCFIKVGQALSTPVSYTHLTLPTIYSV